MAGFYINHFEGEDIDMAEAGSRMFNSNKFMLTPTVIMNTNGQMREESAGMRSLRT